MQFCKRGEGWVVVSGVMLVSHYLVGLGWVGLGWHTHTRTHFRNKWESVTNTACFPVMLFETATSVGYEN